MRDFPLRRPARRGRGRNHPRQIFALATLGLGLFGFSTFGRPTSLVIYNASASAPIGFYFVLPPGQIRRGELVLAHTPPSVRQLAARRHYLPAKVPLVKRVEGLGGDTVCAIHHAVTIDGRHVADQLTADRFGRPLPDWSGCRTLRPAQIFLLMEGVPDSFDGRYFGPVPASAIIGRLVPLWLR